MVLAAAGVRAEAVADPGEAAAVETAGGTGDLAESSEAEDVDEASLEDAEVPVEDTAEAGAGERGEREEAGAEAGGTARPSRPLTRHLSSCNILGHIPSPLLLGILSKEWVH